MDELYEKIKEELAAFSEPKLAEFNAALLRKPGEETLSGTAAHVQGIRLPALRKLAKRLAKEDWQGNLNALSSHVQHALGGEHASGDENAPDAVSFEEVMLWGFLIGCAMEKKRTDLSGQFALIRQYVGQIDNWSLCDSFCAGLKFAREYPAQTWEFILPYLQSDAEYEIRFGVVMIINYFITEEYIDRLFPIFDSIRHEGYYVKMAVAWAVSICYVKFPEETQRYLEQNRLDDFTYNKALQKIVESRCVSDEVRQRMRGMKRSAKREVSPAPGGSGH